MKCAKIYNAHSKPLCSVNLKFGDNVVAVAVMVCLEIKKIIDIIIWQGSFGVNPRVLIGSFLVGSLSYGPFP